MKLLKRCGLLWVLAMAVLTVGAAACGSCAQDSRLIPVGEKPAGADEEIALLDTPTERAEELVEAAVEEWMEDKASVAGDEDIDLQAYQFSIEECLDLVVYLQNEHPEWFSMQLSCLYYVGSDDAVGIRVSYAMSWEEHDQAREVYRSELEAIVDLVDPAWSDLEKILFVHDYLAANYEYDVEGYEAEGANPGTSVAIRDAYRFFSEKKGVCQAYTVAFTAVMQRLGIGVSYVESERINHIWNLVELDGKWYHLDVTHDDPTVDRLGYATHTNFLLSDVAMKTEKGIDGKDWKYGVSDDIDSAYDGYFWQDAISPFVELDGTWYFIEQTESTDEVCTNLRTWDGSSKECSTGTLDSFSDDIREDIGNGYYRIYPDDPSCAGLSEYDGKLYYNSAYRLKCYDPETEGDVKITVLKELTPQERRIIVGLRVDDGSLYYELFDDATKAYDIYYELDIRPFVPVGENVYSYHVEDGQVEIKLDELPKDGYVLIVSYDENDAFADIRFCTKSDIYDLPDGTVKLFAVSGGTAWAPLCEGVEL